MTFPEDDEVKFARLARQTADIRPSAGFSARVLQAVDQGRGFGLAPSLAQSARRLLPVALLCAFGALSWAFVSERSATVAVASSYGEMEFDF
jgi:hypothetical protein